MEFGEAVSFTPGVHEPEKCPFCPLEKKTDPDKKARIGKDNDSETLGKNLAAARDLKAEHLYYDCDFEIYRTYSAEAHHLICGNEVMKEEAQVEKYLIKEGAQTSKGAAGYLKPNDVAYDINGAGNGIWLPSVPDMFRAIGKKKPDRWWGDQTRWNKKHPDKPQRASLEEWEKADAAFIVMGAVKRQFHKGEHGAVGQPHDNYVKMAIGRLSLVSLLAEHYSDLCPMEEDETPRDKPPYWPAHGLAKILDLLSDNLKAELEGPPESWNFYISEFARSCSLQWKRWMAS
jgi:hypothetical protein